MMTCSEAQREIVQEFGALSEWEDKYRFIIKLGRSLPPFPEDMKTEEHTLMSCQTVIWHDVRLDGDKMMIQANCDSMQVRGLIALLLKVYSGRHPQEILDSPPDFLSEIGMEGFQSVNHTTGVEAFLCKLREFAAEYVKKLGA